jgi:hypothetical protein
VEVGRRQYQPLDTSIYILLIFSISDASLGWILFHVSPGGHFGTDRLCKVELCLSRASTYGRLGNRLCALDRCRNVCCFALCFYWVISRTCYSGKRSVVRSYPEIATTETALGSVHRFERLLPHEWVCLNWEMPGLEDLASTLRDLDLAVQCQFTNTEF